MNELNKKLAKWAGFIEMKDNYKGDRYTVGWEYPDDSELGKLPNFTHSLDACFKWLVPKVNKLHQEVIVGSCLTSGAYAEIIPDFGNPDVGNIIEWDTNSALALCKAIEKMIDNE